MCKWLLFECEAFGSCNSDNVKFVFYFCSEAVALVETVLCLSCFPVDAGDDGDRMGKLGPTMAGDWVISNCSNIMTESGVWRLLVVVVVGEPFFIKPLLSTVPTFIRPWLPDTHAFLEWRRFSKNFSSSRLAALPINSDLTGKFYAATSRNVKSFCYCFFARGFSLCRSIFGDDSFEWNCFCYLTVMSIIVP